MTLVHGFGLMVDGIGVCRMRYPIAVGYDGNGVGYDGNGAGMTVIIAGYDSDSS